MYILTGNKISKQFPSAILNECFLQHTVALLCRWLQKWTSKICKVLLSLSYWWKLKRRRESLPGMGKQSNCYKPTVISLLCSHSWRSQVKMNVNDVWEQCSVLSENYLALQLFFVERTTKQNHNVNVDRVELGDENEKANGTTSVRVDLTMLTAMQKEKFKSNVATNTVFHSTK